MINLAYVQEEVEMNKRKELLEKHPYKIWNGKDGKWYTYLPDPEKGRKLVKKSTLEQVENAAIETIKSNLDNPTIKEVFNEWNDRRLELKKISSATHLRNTQCFNRHYKTFGETKVKSVDPEEISEFLEEQIPQFNLTAKAFSNLKTITRGFLKYAKKRKLVIFNAEEIFQELDVSETEFQKIVKEDYQEVFDDKEMPKVMEYLKDNLDIVNLAILTMFVTGIRIGEVVTLKHEDIEDNAIKIRRTETRYKNGKEYVYEVKDFPKTQAGFRTVVVPEDYIWVIKRLKVTNPFSEYIFLKGGKRIHTPSPRMRLRRICARLEIYPKSPHKIRKTYGSILLDNHLDNQLIIGQMGHTNILCTENHYHRNRRGIDKKKEILSSIPDFKDSVITK